MVLTDRTNGELKWLLRQLALFILLRDEIVRDAHRSGITKSQIAEETGIARTTIDRILADASS